MSNVSLTCVPVSDLTAECVPGYEATVDVGSIFLVIFLLCFSALFSGLNLGLMALDTVELEIVAGSGNQRDAKYARALMPIRQYGNFLLCILLLGNTCVNALVAIFLASLTSGLVGSIVSTFSLVIFGEIIPQSFCSRHGLAVGYYTRHVVIFFMIILSPVAFPIALLLDKCMGQELGTVYNRNELRQLVEVHSKGRHGDLAPDEVKMLDGALQFASLPVEKIMTDIKNVFMLNINARMDYRTMSAIVTSGHSRVPIYEGQEITGILLIKNLILLNPEEATPLRSLLPFGIARQPLYVEPDLTLDKMLNEFQKGATHMAVVRRRTKAGDENIGVVTLEDVIEALIQEEIADEGDTPDGSNKRRDDVFVKMYGRRQRFTSSTLGVHELEAVRHYLAGSFSRYFGPAVMADEAIRELLKKCPPVSVAPTNRGDKPKYLYERGKKSDSCFLILGGGPLEILATNAEFRSEAGPWTLLGLDAILKPEGFIPDFSAKVVQPTRVLRIDYRSYSLAQLASTFKKLPLGMGPGIGGGGSGGGGSAAVAAAAAAFLPRTEPAPPASGVPSFFSREEKDDTDGGTGVFQTPNRSRSGSFSRVAPIALVPGTGAAPAGAGGDRPDSSLGVDVDSFRGFRDWSHAAPPGSSASVGGSGGGGGSGTHTPRAGASPSVPFMPLGGAAAFGSGHSSVNSSPSIAAMMRGSSLTNVINRGTGVGSNAPMASFTLARSQTPTLDPIGVLTGTGATSVTHTAHISNHPGPNMIGTPIMGPVSWPGQRVSSGSMPESGASSSSLAPNGASSSVSSSSTTSPPSTASTSPPSTVHAGTHSAFSSPPLHPHSQSHSHSLPSMTSPSTILDIKGDDRSPSTTTRLLPIADDEGNLSRPRLDSGSQSIFGSDDLRPIATVPGGFSEMPRMVSDHPPRPETAGARPILAPLALAAAGSSIAPPPPPSPSFNPFRATADATVHALTPSTVPIVTNENTEPPTDASSSPQRPKTLTETLVDTITPRTTTPTPPSTTEAVGSKRDSSES